MTTYKWPDFEVTWHESSRNDSRVMELTPKHELGDWEVYHPVGAGRGVLTVHKGASAKPPSIIAEMCKVRDVWRVIAAEDGYFIVTVSSTREWARVEAEVIQAYVLAKEKDGN